MGDPEAGPLIQLGVVSTVAGEPLGWQHVIDPPHFHGSDQFRVLAGGDWIHTSAGACSRGSLSELAETTPLTGTFGDADLGPSVEMVRAAPGQRVRVASVRGTEQFLVVTQGSAIVGSEEYGTGDMRVQRADEPMPAIVAGAHGCEITILVADRCHAPVPEQS